ncbi:unnamed protein product [Clonostachys rosea]|uniref:Nudix hydrolase domain-containing protein n=1 Tax=Bionectria ochroleuca TaxID=29856 RepID=A0ABY6UJM3_BIOOC|nr:unnamed protein product [Clonostachys rosea]
MPHTPNIKGPGHNFTVDPAASNFTISPLSYLAANQNEDYNKLATGSLVFDLSAQHEPRILLLQRSAGDSMPNKWETPGGGCDDEDESILHAAARELWEEAGLSAAHISGPVGEPHFFRSRSGKRICKFNFLVQAEITSNGSLEVTLDPNEHQSFVWATLKQVQEKKVNGIELDFTTADTENVILEAFSLVKKDH